MSNTDIDRDIKTDCYRACLKTYCYSLSTCDKNCALLKFCSNTCNKLGVDDGDFDKWSYFDLEKANTIIRGVACIATDRAKLTIK